MKLKKSKTLETKGKNLELDGLAALKDLFSVNPLPKFSKLTPQIFKHSIIPGKCKYTELSSYVSRSRAHDKIYMVHRNGPLKSFKAVKRQTPNFPSPPFSISVDTQPGSSFSLTPLKAKKPLGHKGITTQSQVSPPSCLCVPVVPYI
jgi:hypothetical protein